MRTVAFAVGREYLSLQLSVTAGIIRECIQGSSFRPLELSNETIGGLWQVDALILEVTDTGSFINQIWAAWNRLATPPPPMLLLVLSSHMANLMQLHPRLIPPLDWQGVENGRPVRRPTGRNVLDERQFHPYRNTPNIHKLVHDFLTAVPVRTPIPTIYTGSSRRSSIPLPVI